MKEFKLILFKLLLSIEAIAHVNSISISNIENGCSAYDCKRTCFSADIVETPGDNGIKFEIEGLRDGNKYAPNKVYKG